MVGWDERGNLVPKRAEHRRFVDALCAIEPQIAEAISLTPLGRTIVTQCA
jgi:hypothetical protein